MSHRSIDDDLLQELEAKSVAAPAWPEDPKAREVFDRLVSELPEDPDEDVPKYKECVVAYLDVLGTSHAVRASTESEHAFFHAAGPFGTIHGFLAHLRVQRDLKRNPYEIMASGFSDHVVLSAPATSAGIRSVLESAHNFYGSLLCMNQRLTRGGVAIGELFHDDGIIFGPALLEAHALEEQALYPRIIASPEVIERAGGADNLGTGDTPMVQDGDIYYLDPLRTRCASHDVEDMRFQLQEAAKALLRQNQVSLRVKGAWLARLILACSGDHD